MNCLSVAEAANHFKCIDTIINTGKHGLTESYIKNLHVLDDRNRTAHVYEEEDADEIYGRIISAHIGLFDGLLNVLKKKLTSSQ